MVCWKLIYCGTPPDIQNAKDKGDKKNKCYDNSMIMKVHDRKVITFLSTNFWSLLIHW